MAEYIVGDIYNDDGTSNWFCVPSLDSLNDYYERIVRCKDCKHFDQSTSLFRLNGKCLSERFFACKVKPDGFCAWGEEK